MTAARRFASTLLSKGVISAGWYSILTGLALLYLAHLLGLVGGDPAAPYVAVAFAVTGAWQLVRGARAEWHQRPGR